MTSSQKRLAGVSATPSRCCHCHKHCHCHHHCHCHRHCCCCPCCCCCGGHGKRRRRNAIFNLLPALPFTFPGFSLPTLLSPFGQRLDKRGALADTFGGVTRSMDPAMADPFQQPSPISMGSATSTARRVAHPKTDSGMDKMMQMDMEKFVQAQQPFDQDTSDDTSEMSMEMDAK